MQILIFGATGRTGQQVVTQAKLAGHHVTAFGRREAAGVDQNIIGTFGDSGFIRAVKAADAVISCLASTNRSRICADTASAALEADPHVRYLTVAGAGVDRPDDDKGFGDKMIGAIMRLVVGPMLRDRQQEVDMLAESSARWTALRPPRLISGKPAGRWTVTFDRPASAKIDRADLAAAIIPMIDDPDMINRAPFVAAPARNA